MYNSAIIYRLAILMFLSYDSVLTVFYKITELHCLDNLSIP
uniref:Uncharacterized protein n=1 Tax=Arundo donax TaxID=35708 RepID=A0A0A9C1Q7_ARUDO